MKIIGTVFNSFAERVKEQKIHIVLFGAGTMGRILVPYLCKCYGIEDNIICCIDNNPAKQGSGIQLLSKSVTIYSPEYLRSLPIGSFVILVTNGDFYPVLMQLEQMSELQETEIYLAAVMQLAEEKENAISGIVRCSKKPLIPKVIHYCWFSGGKIPASLQKCIDSWKVSCPDYEIVRWDESNYDINKTVYTQQAHKAGKWGFIPDIARLDILYRYGGFYLDTDVELLKSLDELRFQYGFCAREAWGHVNFGGGSGCQKGLDIVGEILDFRKEVPFILPDGAYNLEASGYFETKPLMDKGLNIRDETQVIDNMVVYSSEYFHPYNYISGEENITGNTLSIHHFNGSWLGESGVRYRRETREKYQMVIKTMHKLGES